MPADTTRRPYRSDPEMIYTIWFVPRVAVEKIVDLPSVIKSLDPREQVIGHGNLLHSVVGWLHEVVARMGAPTSRLRLICRLAGDRALELSNL
jgi:hypothetical protein